jgi:hypothetical protein
MQGLEITAQVTASVKPTTMRLQFPIRAEESTNEKAAERLYKHLEAVEASLIKLGAKKDSIQYSDVEGGQTSFSIGLANMLSSNPQYAVANFAQPAMMGVGMAEAAIAFPPASLPNMREPRDDPENGAFSPPKLYGAHVSISADWDISEKSLPALGLLKLKIIDQISAQSLDGRLLKASFTEEQEDEIFERTKLDLRNPAVTSGWSTNIQTPVEQSVSVSYIGTLDENEYSRSVDRAYELAGTTAKVMAKSGNLTLGKITSAKLVVDSDGSDLATASESIVNYTPYPMYSVSSYTMGGNRSHSWKPALKPYEVSSKNPTQVQQQFELRVRYNIN